MLRKDLNASAVMSNVPHAEAGRAEGELIDNMITDEDHEQVAESGARCRGLHGRRRGRGELVAGKNV